MTVLGLKLSPTRQRGQLTARPHQPPHVGSPVALARRRRRFRSATSPTACTSPVWLAWQMQQLYDRHFPADWSRRMGEPEVWQNIHDVDPGELWETHNALEEPAVDVCPPSRQPAMPPPRRKRRRRRSCPQRARPERPDDRLRTPLCDLQASQSAAQDDRSCWHRLRERSGATGPVHLRRQGSSQGRTGQAVHPADLPTCATIRRFKDRVVFVEDYDINVCRHLIQGVDVWLNNPRRPLEASGTSGQKVVLNGGLNLSILDGWWAEAYDGSNGFAIGNGT